MFLKYTLLFSHSFRKFQTCKLFLNYNECHDDSDKERMILFLQLIHIQATAFAINGYTHAYLKFSHSFVV